MRASDRVRMALGMWLARPVGIEARKVYWQRLESGFFDRYLSGPHILDVGYRGGRAQAVPIVPHAVGVDLDYPGYDGTRLPFPDSSQDALFVSHCLEHIEDYRASLADWYRVLKTGGYLLVFVPHKYLYERRAAPPSALNPDHKRFYTPGSLLAEIEESLPVNGFRVRHLADNDYAYDYEHPITKHPRGCYEIELVVQKLARPSYSDALEPSSDRQAQAEGSAGSTEIAPSDGLTRRA
ncbi:MAG: methyltransferase domain-containing protein [Sinobacteraceae bacterium]|nr:methyltransferase domain-containing protein [Nevskiaceae bacterium]